MTRRLPSTPPSSTPCSSTPPRVTCLVSDRDDLALLPDLAHAGIASFQVRAKGATTRGLVALTRTVRTAVTAYGATVIVDDRVDVALAAGADGVHLGQDDLAITDARRIAPDLVVGATCRDRAQVEAAAAAGADYVGFGPVFASVSKADLPPPLGLSAIASVAGLLPVVAIGGLDATTAAEARAAGADGVAVIGAIWRHRDPVTAAKELVDRTCG